MDDDNARLLIQYESYKKRIGIAYFLLLIGGGLGLHLFYLHDKKLGGLLCLLTCVGVTLEVLEVRVLGIPPGVTELIGALALGAVGGMLLVNLFTLPREVRDINRYLLQALEKTRDEKRYLQRLRDEEGSEDDQV